MVFDIRERSVKKVRYSLYIDSELLGLLKSGYRKLSSVESFNEYCVRKLREGFLEDILVFRRDFPGSKFFDGAKHI